MLSRSCSAPDSIVDPSSQVQQQQLRPVSTITLPPASFSGQIRSYIRKHQVSEPYLCAAHTCNIDADMSNSALRSAAPMIPLLHIDHLDAHSVRIKTLSLAALEVKVSPRSGIPFLIYVPHHHVQVSARTRPDLTLHLVSTVPPAHGSGCILTQLVRILLASGVRTDNTSGNLDAHHGQTSAFYSTSVVGCITHSLTHHPT